MIIGIWDVDVPYDVRLNVTDYGKDVVEIIPNSAQTDRDDDYNIVLDYDKVQELIRVLTFISEEIKPK